MTSISASQAAKIFTVLSGPALAALVPIAVVPALPAMAKVFAADGDGVLFAQMIQALPSALILLGAPLGAFLSERFGRRACMLTSMLIFVVCGCSGVVIDDFILLVALRLVLGLATGVIMGLSITFAGDYFEGDTRERILGYAAASSSVVSVVIVFAGGWLVEWFSWRAPFIFYAFGLVTFAIVWFGVTGPTQSEAREHHASPERAVSHILRLLWPAYLLVLVLATGVFMLSVQGPFLLEARGVESAGVRGMILSVYSLTAFIFSMSYGYLRRILNSRAILAVTAFSMALGLLAAALVQDPRAFVLVTIIVGIGAGLTDPAVNSIVLARAPEAGRARAVGAVVSAFFIGQVVTPVISDPIRRAFSIGHAFAFEGLLLLATGAIVLLNAYFVNVRDHGAVKQAA